MKFMKDQSAQATARVVVPNNAQLHIACGYPSWSKKCST